MFKVTADGKTYEAYANELLSDFLIRIGRPVSMPCAGRGTCGKCRVIVNGTLHRACRYVIGSDIEISLPSEESIVSETGAEACQSAGGKTALVLDIGTTALAMAAVSCDEQKIIRTVTGVNPQRAFGADVMSRIACCMERGPALLHKEIISAVANLIEKLGDVNADTLYVSGNTTMLHLFFGEDCSNMGVFPYTPAFLGSKEVPGNTLGLSAIKTVISLPCAAAFVGADITAGLNFIGAPENGLYRMLIDLGTNAETVLFSREKAVCTAAAAGPCFEGAEISCGMSASPGAIYAYSADGYSTVGDKPAAGICGTGLVDIIAELLRNGTVDKTGYMACESYEIAPSVTLTQSDVRKYQLAKSAVCSAVQALIKREQISYDDIENVYISGGFSAKINIENAVITGLLPAELKNKCVSIGNSSLLGTVKYVFEKNDLAALADKMEYADLAADEFFSERFIKNMMFKI